MKVDYEAVIEAYKNGESMNSIAKAFGTYATTVKEGELYVKDGEKLIEWAKAQGRLVTKAELAAVIGRKKLSPSYFLKYPELGQYVTIRGNHELDEYYEKLYGWLKARNIPYKPCDRTKLGVTVDALLLDDYAGIALQISEKPKTVSKKAHEENTLMRIDRAGKAGLTLIHLNAHDLENLDKLKDLLSFE